MRIHRSATDEDGTRFPIATLQDERLSWAACGVLIRLLVQENGSDLTADELALEVRQTMGSKRGQGRQAVRAVFAELERYGYMVRDETRDARGRLNTELHVYDIPQHEDMGPPVRRTGAAKYPRGEYVYRHWDSERNLLYVGVASKPSRREQQHLKSSPWMVFHAETTLERFDVRTEAEAAEAAAILSERPLFNVAGNESTDARKRLAEYLAARGRPDLLAPVVSHG